MEQKHHRHFIQRRGQVWLYLIIMSFLADNDYLLQTKYVIILYGL